MTSEVERFVNVGNITDGNQILILKTNIGNYFGQCIACLTGDDV